MSAALIPSDRKFGWTFAVLFLLIGALYHPLLVALGALVGVITVARAHWLAPAKHAWMNLGERLHRVASPIAMGAVFFGVFVPIGVVMRLAGYDAMRRRFEPGTRSYWVKRDPPGPADDSFGNLF